MFAAKRALGRGVRSDRWPAASLEPVRLALNSRWASSWQWGTLAVAVASLLAVALVHGDFGRSGAGLWYLFVLLSQMIADMRSTLRVAQPRLQENWQGSKRLVSDHWGEGQRV